jgi:hypothetical protein
MNSKVSARHGSTPYSLMFARPLNGFQVETQPDELHSNLLDPASLLQRLRYMTAVVYPTIAARIKSRQDLEGVKFLKKNLIITDQFSPGAFVMVQDELRSSKMQPRYTGPFQVIKRNRGGAYLLQGNDGSQYTRPPHRLKLVMQDPLKSHDVHLEVSEILESALDDTGHTIYLVRWKDKTINDTWVLETDFDDLTPIRKFQRSNRIRDEQSIDSLKRKPTTVPTRSSKRLSSR